MKRLIIWHWRRDILYTSMFTCRKGNTSIYMAVEGFIERMRDTAKWQFFTYNNVLKRTAIFVITMQINYNIGICSLGNSRDVSIFAIFIIVHSLFRDNLLSEEYIDNKVRHYMRNITTHCLCYFRAYLSRLWSVMF